MAMTLPNFIEQVGEAEAARIGQVKPRTIQAYRRRERYPRPEVAERFVATGKVDWEGIYKPEPESGAAAV